MSSIHERDITGNYFDSVKKMYVSQIYSYFEKCLVNIIEDKTGQI